jgi:GT2 family glycosyltransferase
MSNRAENSGLARSRRIGADSPDHLPKEIGARSPWRPDEWSASTDKIDDPTLPLITIGILSYNRCDDLARTLDVIFPAVEYPRFEVIVVDNASTDGTKEMVRERFPEVLLLAQEHNHGTSARNLQPLHANGKYLFSFDDDSIPATPATILRIVRYLERHPEVDVLNSTCYQPFSGITETEGWQAFRYATTADAAVEGIYLVEGGVCFRVSTLRKIEGYDPAIFYASEGPDLALQLYARGGHIVLCSWFATLHFKSPVNRQQYNVAFWGARHTVWMIAKHFPILLFVILVGLFFLRRVVLGSILDPATTRSRLRGFWEGIRDSGPFRKKRPKLSILQAVKLRRFYLQLYRW